MDESHSPSLLTPVTAMLTGRVLRTGVVLLVTTWPEFVVEVDIALPGRDILVDMLFGVISPDRKPKVFSEKFFCLDILL